MERTSAETNQRFQRFIELSAEWVLFATIVKLRLAAAILVNDSPDCAVLKWALTTVAWSPCRTGKLRFGPVGGGRIQNVEGAETIGVDLSSAFSAANACRGIARRQEADRNPLEKIVLPQFSHKWNLSSQESRVNACTEIPHSFLSRQTPA